MYSTTSADQGVCQPSVLEVVQDSLVVRYLEATCQDRQRAAAVGDSSDMPFGLEVSLGSLGACLEQQQDACFVAYL